MANNEYVLTLTYVDDIATVTINDETINISAFTSPQKYERDVSGYVNPGLNTVTVVAQNVVRKAGCTGSITRNGQVIYSWNVVMEDGTAPDRARGPFLSETFKFMD